MEALAHTPLALSRNWATIALKRSQIIDRDDIICGSEVMTDGAGRMSLSLALKITEKLGLSHLPSGFQGRLGEAKGFWSVYYGDETGKDWIENYKSQRKWTRSMKSEGEADDPSHLVFEVVGFSSSLKSKALNEQILPILMDRARDKNVMKQSIKSLMKESLKREVEEMSDAMANPLLLKKWLFDAKSNVDQRLKAGRVPYTAAMPRALEEKLIMLLDGGFNPQDQFYLKDLMRKAFKLKCDDIVERLKITVDKSASIFMVPDFLGILEPNEVYVDLTNFVDKSSPLSGTSLRGKDVLVTRSPAHLPSDIQRVTVVAKEEFLELKDVIVFPTKGPSLANKLSGGDFDGDRAWVCWEPTLVENFVNAEVPECPDLVKLGYIKKDSRTYAELVEGHANANSVFLKASFAFNMQSNLLPICSDYKENVCWTQNSVSTRESILLSTLVGSLVDAPKQGYRFQGPDWKRLLRGEVRMQPRKPSYKESKEPDRQSEHIIDRLRCCAADTSKECIEKFHMAVNEGKDPPTWDDDLVKFYMWALDKSAENEEWKDIISDLNAKLSLLKSKWGVYWQKHMPKNFFEEPTGDFHGILNECFESYLNICPSTDTPLTQLLLGCGDPQQSEWARLKASALFYMCGTEKSPFPWLMAGIQLVQLKGKFGGDPLTHTVVSSMYAGSKYDKVYIQRYMSRMEGAIPVEDGALNLEDDEEDE